MYQVGLLRIIKPDDPKFDELWEAHVEAADKSAKDRESDVWAIWDVEDGFAIKELWHEGLCYRA